MSLVSLNRGYAPVPVTPLVPGLQYVYADVPFLHGFVGLFREIVTGLVNSPCLVSPCECADRFSFFQVALQLSVVSLCRGTCPVVLSETALSVASGVWGGVR